MFFTLGGSHAHLRALSRRREVTFHPDSKGADTHGGLCDVVCSDGTGLPTLRPRAWGAVGWGGLCSPPAAQGLQCAL